MYGDHAVPVLLTLHPCSSAYAALVCIIGRTEAAGEQETLRPRRWRRNGPWTWPSCSQGARRSHWLRSRTSSRPGGWTSTTLSPPSNESSGSCTFRRISPKEKPPSIGGASRVSPGTNNPTRATRTAGPGTGDGLNPRRAAKCTQSVLEGTKPGPRPEEESGSHTPPLCRWVGRHSADAPETVD